MKNGDYNNNYNVNWILEERTIFINGEIDEILSCDVWSKMHYLDSLNHEDITLCINSVGGVVRDGLMIFDAINEVKSDVRTICIGKAYSMGAFLLGAGTYGKREATPNSEIMIHQPITGAQGQVSDVKIEMEHAVKIKQKMNEYMSIFTNKPIKQIELDTDRNFYMSPEEALNYGLIDRIRVTEIKAKRG